MLTRKDKERKDTKVVFAALSICLVLLVATALAARGGRSGSRGGGSRGGGGFKGGSGGSGQRSGAKSSQVARPARSGAKSSQVARPARSGGSQTRIANPARSSGGRANVGAGRRSGSGVKIGAGRRSGRVQQAPSHSRPSHRKPPKGKVTNRSTIWAQMAQQGRRFSVTRGNPGAFSAFEKDEPRRRKRPPHRPKHPRRRDRRPRYVTTGTDEGTGKIERRADRGAAERQVTNRSGEAGSKRGGGLKFTRRHRTSSDAKPRNRTVVKFKSNGSRKDSLLRRESILRDGAGRRGHGPGNRKREYHKGDRSHRFSGRHWRRHKQIIWPRRRHIVHYRHGRRSTFRNVFPRHHRKYVFVSLGGYWPLNYGYRRYYWYGWHPYYWYGYYPAAYEVAGDTYNYYTYNYDGETIDAETGALTSVDADTFADVRERLAKEPEAETEADRLFDEGVKAFEAGDYDKAADKFADAGRLDPDDMILPFAHVQALFADEEYTKAAKALRQALAQLPQDQQEVFFPRGLYQDQETLLEQIAALAVKAGSYSFGGDLELLLGYQLLGTGRLDEAQELLVEIESDSKNAAAAETLLVLSERIRTPAPETDEAEDSDVY